MNAEDTYLRSVERMLAGIAPEHRSDVLDDLRGHFADAEEAGRSVDETIRGLGTPTEIAARAREEFGETTDAADARAERAWRVLQGAAVAVAVVIGVVVAFVLPSYSGSSEIVTSDGLSVHEDTAQTLAEVNGMWVALITLVPAAIVFIPLVLPRAMRTAAASICGMLLIAATALGSLTVGGYFLPVVLLAGAAVIVWLRLRGRGFGRVWRIAGGVLAALPVLLVLPMLGLTGGGALFGAPRRYADYAEGAGPTIGIEALGWVVIVALLVASAFIIVGHRWAGWTLAAIGVTALITGLTSGDLLTLAFVWLGGWWLTIGLAHALTASRR